MKTRIKCPATGELQQLIDGTLPDERQAECTDHMDSCECCQAKLEELATSGTNLSQLVERVNEAEPVADSAYWPAMQALDNNSAGQNVAETYVPPPVARTRNVSLKFLQPATDSAYLGRLAHFDVMRLLGRGGMGIVLEAFDSKLQRNVALKVLDPELAEDETSRQRFCREARAAASITHENVVAVHQVEKFGDGGLPYLVMQLIQGESLEQRLNRVKKLPLREIVRISMQAAHGLEAAHIQGLIHRDIKPGNILLEAPHDRVKLTDFGLARATEDVKLTRTGFVSGTPLYMSPEQALGEDADPRSDLFSLGAIMYEMCAGQPPFSGNSALAILKQITETKPRPVSELNPSVPGWLADTINSLLARKPADRIQTAAHLAELLDFQWALMKTTTEDVPTVCQIEQGRRAMRNRRMAIAIGLGFLSLGLVSGLFLARPRPASGVKALVSTAEPIATLSANAGSVWSAAFDPSSPTVAMASEDGTVRLWDIPSQSVSTSFDAHRGAVWVTKYARSGEWLVTSGDDGAIKLWKSTEAEPVKVFRSQNAVRGLAVSHDDKTLYAGDRDGGLRVWSIDSDQPIRETQQAKAIYTVALSPNDETLATAGADKDIRLWNAKTLTQKLVLQGHAGQIYSLAFSPDGQRLVSVGWDKTIRVWDVASGMILKSWPGLGDDIWSVAFCPAGRKIATGSNDGAVRVWDSDTGALLGTYLGHKIAIHAVTFSRNGEFLASGGRDGAVRLWKMKE